MAGVKNHEVSAILQKWLDMAGISQAEAARQQDITPPVLWRQITTRDSMPLARIQEFARRWSPSEEETSRLETLLNDLSSNGRRCGSAVDFDRCIGRLEAILAMLDGAIYSSMPDNTKDVVKTVSGLIQSTISDLDQKKTGIPPERSITLPGRNWKRVAFEQDLEKLRVESAFLMKKELELEKELKDIPDELKRKIADNESEIKRLEDILSSMSED